MQNESKKGTILTRLIDSSLLESYINQGWKVSKPAKPYGQHKWAYWVWRVVEMEVKGVNSTSTSRNDTGNRDNSI